MDGVEFPRLFVLLRWRVLLSRPSLPDPPPGPSPVRRPPPESCRHARGAAVRTGAEGTRRHRGTETQRKGQGGLRSAHSGGAPLPPSGHFPLLRASVSPWYFGRLAAPQQAEERLFSGRRLHDLVQQVERGAVGGIGGEH